MPGYLIQQSIQVYVMVSPVCRGPQLPPRSPSYDPAHRRRWGPPASGDLAEASSASSLQELGGIERDYHIHCGGQRPSDSEDFLGTQHVTHPASLAWSASQFSESMAPACSPPLTRRAAASPGARFQRSRGPQAPSQ
eukprot:4508371-Pyramimonas_sp.AAC.1